MWVSLKCKQNPSESPRYTLPDRIESVGQIAALVEGNESVLGFWITLANNSMSVKGSCHDILER